MNKQSSKNILINFLFAKKYKTCLYVYGLPLSFVSFFGFNE